MKVSLLSSVVLPNNSIASNKNSKQACPISNVQQREKVPNTVLKAYYCNGISFGRRTEEHLHNGAYVDKEGIVHVKLFTYPDIKKVSIKIKDKGEYPLEKTENQIFQTKLLPSQVQDGDKYCFKLIGNDGRVIEVKDPYAMKQENVIDKYSTIYDHHQFKWSDDEWMKGHSPEKISRRGQKTGQKTLNDLKICEVNIATLTQKGDFESAKKYVDKVAKDGIFNAIHIMPVENTYSYNWGYDGVDKFAPQDSFLGGPDKLKELINHAHEKKINVIMDLVPNHIGPDGNYLSQVAPYIDNSKDKTFGDKFNVENDPQNNKHVRDYLANACLNWLNNYHCDGLRLDLTSGIESNYTMKQIAMETHYHNPDAFLIAEDGRGNMPEVTRPLSPNEEGTGLSEDDHAAEVNLVSENKLPLSNIGFDSEWDFPYYHALNDAVFSCENMNDFDAKVKNSGSRVKYAMSHDEIGNFDGTRLIVKVAKEKLNMFNKVSGSDDSDKHKKAAHATEAIILSKIHGYYDEMSQPERMHFLQRNNVVVDIKPEDVDKALFASMAKNKLAVGHPFITPGPKMIFQGDEEANLSYFKFFRQFTPDSEVADLDLIYLPEKGYKPGYQAFQDSKLNGIDYPADYRKKMDQTHQYFKDLSNLVSINDALEQGYIAGTVVHDASNLHAVHLKKDNNEIFTISNFKDLSYKNDYGIVFPKGEWQEVLNSDDAKYAGSGEYSNETPIASNGSNATNIALPANSLLIFKKVN